MKNQCFRLPKCFRKLRVASGCSWLPLPRGLPSKFKIQNLGARMRAQILNFEFCGTGRPGPDNIFAPRPQNFRARGAKILWPGCENVAVRAAMGLKVARFWFWLTNLMFLRYFLTNIMFSRLKVQKVMNFSPRRATKHKYNSCTLKNAKISELFPPEGN